MCYPVGRVMLDSSTPVPSLPVKHERRSRRVQALVFGLVLALVLFFGYKVFNYYRQIQKGTFDPMSLSFQSTAASQNRLIDIAAAAPGSGQLATLDDPSLGPNDAKLTIVEFADFGCPFSEEESYVVDAIARQYPNDVRIIYRDFPLTDLHPGADMPAEPAAEQPHEARIGFEQNAGGIEHCHRDAQQILQIR